MVKTLANIRIGDRLPVPGSAPVIVTDKISMSPSDPLRPFETAQVIELVFSNGESFTGRRETTLTVFPLDHEQSESFRALHEALASNDPALD